MVKIGKFIKQSLCLPLMDITLDEKTKEIINNIPLDILRENDKYYLLYHEIMFYGVNTLATIFLMNKVKHVSSGIIPLEEFTQKYALDFSDSTGQGGFGLPLKKIEEEKIFIPDQRYVDQKLKIITKWGKPKISYELTNNPNKQIYLFDHDSINRVDWKNETEIKECKFLTGRKWTIEDLKNEELLDKSIALGNILWKSVVKSHRLHIDKKFAPAHIEKASENLFEYYSNIITLSNSYK